MQRAGLFPLLPLELHIAMASVAARGPALERVPGKATSVAGAAGTGAVVGGSRLTAVPAAAAAAAVVASYLGVDGAAGAEISVHLPAAVVVVATPALLAAVRAVPGVLGVASAAAVSAAVLTLTATAAAAATSSGDPGVERSQVGGLGRV